MVQHAISYTRFSTCTVHVHSADQSTLASEDPAHLSLQTRYDFLQSYEPQNSHLHSIRVIKRRALAGGRMDCASDFLILAA